MQLFNAETVHKLLPYDALIPALHKMHEGEIPSGNSVHMKDPSGADNMFVTLPGWLSGQLIVVKMVGVFPNNRERKPPLGSVLGAVAAFNAKTGAPILVADGEAMTYRKTAAISGLGTAQLAPPNPRNLLIVGAGGLAQHVAMAHIAARSSIRQVHIWNRTVSNANTLAAKLNGQGIDARVASSLDSVVPEADIISCVTMSDEPLVRGALLKPGSHLDLVGSYLPHMRETDDDAMRRGSVYTCCDRGREDIGELTMPIASGALRMADIKGDAFDLAQGRSAGRESPEEITIFKNIGGAHQDVFTTVVLKQIAKL